MILDPTANANILIAEYTLGLLGKQEVTQAHRLLSQKQHAKAALEWESRLLDLVDLLPPVAPPASLLKEVQGKLGHTPTASKPPPAPPVHVPPAMNAASHHDISTPRLLKRNEAVAITPAAATISAAPTAMTATAATTAPIAAGPTEPKAAGNIWVWRAASIVLGAIVIAFALMPSAPVAPPITIVEVAPTQVAILQAPGQSSTPGWVVTVDPKGNVLMDPHVRSDIPAEASAQLWTRNKHSPQPRSLGLIDPNKPVTIPASLMGPIEPDQLFEITQEASGGSPTGSPGGPILFIGRVVVFGASSP
ncbi:MAG TPA: anti-sigma factor [Candidimonas sp.]|nr:anti-sigma factor [Candidimonas sp.]